MALTEERSVVVSKGKVTVPMPLVFGILGLMLGGGVAVPVLRATAAPPPAVVVSPPPPEEAMETRARHEGLDTRLRDIELDARGAAEWRKGVDAQLGQIAGDLRTLIAAGQRHR